ncbi:hypothetical protein [Thermomonas carbonis]|uniref:Uncharacterized protein n=1 Tax=Thermomonas carbonis TaxID=1463158 RepID=A0A7G9SP36_9GAMM|nr:hypothetical protein [Thermomonas carbonis]QNN69611.1 hypothetical protein H9L16_13220 [Thermomonas carbonis]
MDSNPASGAPFPFDLKMPLRRSLIAYDGFFEIYTENQTYRLQHPTGDMSRKDFSPESTFVTTLVADAGSRNLTIARLILQTHECMQSAPLSAAERQRALTVLHACKDALLSCEDIANQLKTDVDSIIEGIKQSGFWQEGQSMKLPQHPSLQTQASTYLVHLNRSIRKICEFAFALLELDRKDNNFKDLAKRVGAKLGVDSMMYKYVHANVERIENLILLRNFDEHPGDTTTVLRNFHLAGPRAISAPTWELTGAKATAPKFIAEDAIEQTAYVRGIAENVVMFALNELIQPPLMIMQINEDHIDPAWPVRFRVHLDTSRMTFVSPNSRDPT